MSGGMNVCVKVTTPNAAWSFTDGSGGEVKVAGDFHREDNIVRAHFRVQFVRDRLDHAKRTRKKPRYIVLALVPIPYTDARLLATQPLSCRCGSPLAPNRYIRNTSYGADSPQSEDGISEARWILAFKDKKMWTENVTDPWDLYCDWKVQAPETRLPVMELMVYQVVRRSAWEYIVNDPNTWTWRPVHIRLPPRDACGGGGGGGDTGAGDSREEDADDYANQSREQEWEQEWNQVWNVVDLPSHTGEEKQKQPKLKHLKRHKKQSGREEEDPEPLIPRNGRNAD